MSHARTTRRVVLGTLATTAVLLSGASPATAAHAEVVGAVDCGGTVSWTVTAWAGRPSTPTRPGASERSRTNPDIELQVSMDGRPFRPAVQHLSLDADNRFTVSGTFELPDGERPRTVVLRTVARAEWSSGAAGLPRRSPEIDLSRCDEDVDRRPVWLGGGAVGAVAAWLLTRPRRRTS